MKDIRVAAVQMNAVLGKPGQNLAAHRPFIERAALAKCDLVCFPELSISGHFCHKDSWKDAESIDGPSVTTLCKWASEFRIIISAGIAERIGNVACNAQVLVGPKGLIGRQHKIHMSRDEYFFYRGGSELSVFDIGKVKIGICICYDIMHPEVARVLSLKGAEVILFPHAARCGSWKEVSKRQPQVVRENQDLMKMICAARCYDNAVFGVYNNQCGNAAPHRKDPVAVHAGGMLLYDPLGKRLAESKSRHIGEDEMVLATFKAADREKLFPIVKLLQRRTELFKPIVQS